MGVGNASNIRIAHWSAPTAAHVASHGNTDDATENGAYCLAIAAIEQELGLFFISRAERKTGADIYADADPFAQDMETAHRVEVSGIDLGGIAAIRERLRRKLLQLGAVPSSNPEIAVVVGFEEATILVRKA